MTGFADHFSGGAAGYARYRPGYPEKLFDWLGEVAPARGQAWDVGTGSGQVAAGLASRFARVTGSDPSADQVTHAERRPNVEYRVEAAEDLSAAPASLDLVTVGQALHWFDLPRFYAAARRGLKPRGVLAAWTYNLCAVSPDIDRAVRRLYGEIVGPWWPPERRIVEEGYRTLEFPFARVEPPPLAMEADWDCERYLGYLGTWSACQRYAKARGSDPVAEVAGEIRAAWGSPGAPRRIQWPLAVLCGRI